MFATSPTAQPSATVKIFVIGVVSAALVVPLLMIAVLAEERAERRTDVALELASVWGQRQTAAGPILAIPYERETLGKDGPVTTRDRVFILPESLTVDASLVPEVRRRSIFAVTLYRSTLTMSGRFAPPDLGKLGIAGIPLLWERAAVYIGLADLRGAVSVTPLTWGAASLELEPAGDEGPFGPGLRAAAPTRLDDGLPFRVELTLAGSTGLSFLPAGKLTSVTLQSRWPHPSFMGSFLPTEQTVETSGFRATWQVTALARAYPQAWLEGSIPATASHQRLHASAFGVDLVSPVDHYQQVSRALKYSFLFIVLTFGVFFAWEMIARLRLHAIQYLFVGLTLVVFFLLLLAFAEHTPFAVAYAVASAATILAVAGYAARVLVAGRSGQVIGAWLTVLYSLLFVLLRLEDFALLVGAVAVFVCLVALMYLTRGVDWHGAGREALRGTRLGGEE